MEVIVSVPWRAALLSSKVTFWNLVVLWEALALIRLWISTCSRFHFHSHTQINSRLEAKVYLSMSFLLQDHQMRLGNFHPFNIKEGAEDCLKFWNIWKRKMSSSLLMSAFVMDVVSGHVHVSAVERTSGFLTRLCSAFTDPPHSAHCRLFFSSVLQIFAACRVSWTRRPVRAWTWPCREWTGISAKSSPTSSPPWGPRSSTGTETLCAEPSCCSAPTERTRSSSRSVHVHVQLKGMCPRVNTGHVCCVACVCCAVHNDAGDRELQWIIALHVYDECINNCTYALCCAMSAELAEQEKQTIILECSLVIIRWLTPALTSPHLTYTYLIFNIHSINYRVRYKQIVSPILWLTAGNWLIDCVVCKGKNTWV